MQSTIRHIIFSLVMAATAANAQEPADTADMSIKVAPAIADDFTDEEVVIPPFIVTDANHINLNGNDWSGLRRRIARADSSVISVVHIGDSHIQADFATGKTRTLMQNSYGNAGRGLIVPLKMAGTNEPRDYMLKSTGKWEASKLMKRNGTVAVGFTGIGISPVDEHTDITVATLSRSGNPDPFNRLKIYHTGKFLVDSVSAYDAPLSFYATYTDSVTTLELPKEVDNVTLSIVADRNTAMFGMVLAKSDTGGIMYHAIGNNGATYRSYNLLPESARNICDLNPDLIIVSLGGNEAFGKLTGDELYDDIDTYVKNISRRYPEAKIVLTTPMECQRSIRTRKGKKRRRTYMVNEKIAPIRATILRYAKENGIAVYDWYEVAGGSGASKKWTAAELMSKDRIHHSVAGYRLQGQLLYDALTESLK